MEIRKNYIRIFLVYLYGKLSNKIGKKDIMDLKNIFSVQLYPENSHGGKGALQKCRMWDQSDFETGLQYMDYVTLKPNESIGIHTHGEDEEIYVILKGYGNLYSNGQNLKVKPGDVIVNSFHDMHGLENNSDTDMELFIFDVAKMEVKNGITNK